MHNAAVERKVWLLGKFRVEERNRLLEIPVGQLQNLFAYLILHPDIPHSRERIATLLWPETDPNRAGRNLSNLLYRLKQILAPAWLESSNEALILRTSSELWVDFHMFESLANSESVEQLRQALALYQGDLLPQLYDDWTHLPRERLRETFLVTLSKLGHLAETANQPESALSYYRQLLGVDPVREDAARGQMRCQAVLGRFSEALDTFAVLDQTLQAEIGVQPGLETRLLADRLRNEWELVQRVSSQPTPYRFVGRVIERARLLALLDRAQQGNGGLVVVLGEPGIGKTRLFQELSHAAEWRGWQVAWGYADEFTLPTPYKPLSQALERAMAPARLEQLARSIPALSLSIIASFIPGLPQNSPQTDKLSLDQLEFALRQVLFGLQKISPHLFLLDDVQWADPALWPILDRLRTTLREMHILLALNLRTSEVRTQPVAWELIQKWDQAGDPVIHLSGLNLEEMRELLASQSLTHLQIERLAETTGGNPLFTLQLLNEGDLENRLAEDLSLTDLALRRVAPLSAQAQYALQIASVLGSTFDYSTWEAVLKRGNISVENLPALAGEAERAGMIFLSREGYRFAHDTLRASIYTHIPDAVRKNFHQQVLAVISQSAPSRTVDLLYHAQQAGSKTHIARYALQAGEQTFASFNYAASAEYFNQALDALAENETANRYRVYLWRTRAHEILGQRDVQRESLEMLQKLADHLGDARRQAETARYVARYQWQTGNYLTALEVATHGLEQATQAHDREMQAALLEILGRTARDQGDYLKAKTQFEQALNIYQNIGDEAGQALILNNLGILTQRQGYSSEAIQFNLKAYHLYRKLGDIYGEARAYGNLGVAYWTSGDYAKAREYFEKSLAVNRQLGDRRAEIAQLSNLGGLFGILGDPENALARYELALKLNEETGEKAFRASLLANRGVALYDLGRWDQALTSLDEALTMNREIGRKRGEGYVLYTRGITLIELGRMSEALSALEASLTIRHELGERDNLADTYCTLTRFHLSQGKQTLAEKAYQSAQQFLDLQQVSTEIRRNFHYSSFLIFQAQRNTEAALSHLLRAEEAMLFMSQALPESDRARFLNILPPNQKIQEALLAHFQQIEVQLVCEDVPLGKKLVAEDYVAVTWTLSTPGDDQLTPPSARRQHILHRLLTEAAAQGAAPTDDDLAQALGVSRRTVLRDIQALKDQGVDIKTRQRGSSEK